MKIIFFGTSIFAVPALRVLSPHVVLVVSQPDRPAGRGHRLQESPLKKVARELGLPIETPAKSRAPEFVDFLRSLEADALWVAAYGQILSEPLLNVANRGGINLHGSILPKYRGAAPIQRCLMNGDSESGVTLMQMDKGMDTGNMIAIERLAIHPDETYGELQTRLAVLAAEMSTHWVERIVSGNYPQEPQNPNDATMAPKIDRAECELSFERPVQQEYNRFRGVTPSPGAFLQTRFGRLVIRSARLGQNKAEPGTWLGSGEVSFIGGSLILAEIQPEGKKRMAAIDFANGLRLKPGDRLI